MKKIVFVAIFIILAGLVFLLAKNGFRKTAPPAPANNISTSASVAENENPTQEVSVPSAPTDNQNAPAIQNPSGFEPPLDQVIGRVTKKPFGIYITPKTSPVQPERFQGFHTGTDFEIFPEELNTDVSVHAVCSGKIIAKRTASGYGGVLVQNCMQNSEPITMIYGHLKLASITKNIGDNLRTGDTIGILGKAYSSETDGERKHLHLGIHKGSSISILGYVGAQSELSGWIDPCTLVCK